MTLDTRYSPRTFEEVVGQPFAVKTIQQIVQRGEPKPLLLYGPHGTGKTSLARVFARALNCLHPLSSWSPCLRCGPCNFIGTTNEGLIYHEIACGELPDDGGAYIADMARLPGIDGTQRVIFLDELQLLPRKASGGLLAAFETPGIAAFVCATTDIHMVSGPLLSRCTRIPLRKLSDSELIEFGMNVCSEEGIAAEPYALALLASAADGHMRDYLGFLEQHSRDGVLRVADVANGLDLAWADVALRTMVAVTNRDYEGARTALAEWTAHPKVKAAGLRDALTHAAHVGFTPRREHPEATAAFLLASPAILDELIEGLRRSVGGEQVPPLSYVLALADHWSHAASTVKDKGDLEKELLRAAHAVSPTDLTLPPLPDEAFVSKPPTPVRRHRSQRTLGTLPRNKARPEYLTYADVKGQYQSATMLPQRFGVWFNVRLRMPFGVYGITDPNEAMTFLSNLKRELRLRLRSWSHNPAQLLHFIQQTEITDEDGLTSWLVMHVPPQDVTAAHDWVITQLPVRVGELTPTLEPDMWRAPLHGRPAAIQWSLMRELWRSMDPRLLGVNGSRKEALKELLSVPSQGPRVGGVLPPRFRRWSASGELTTTEWTKAYKDRFGFLSIIEHQAWQALERGWELDEFRHRDEETKRRAEEIKRIESLAPGSDALAKLTRERKVRAFFDRLPFDPLRRPRDTPPW